MKKDGICGRVFGWVVPAAVAVCAVPCGAEMLYYLPFDDGVSATLVNYGSAGGAATAERMTEWGGAPAPTNSTETVAPNLGGTHALKCTRQGTNGGLLAMPDSTNRFRLTDTSGRMTVCTWIYWKGYYESGIANAMPTTDNQGWSWRIGASGEFKMLYKTATSGGTRTTGAGTIPSNVWLHVAMRWDCSSNYALQWFVNGIATNASLTYTGSGVLNTSTQDVAVANANQSPLGGGYLSLNGYMDDCAIWDTLLSAGKIRALAAAPGVLPGFNAGILNRLFSLFDAAEGMAVITNGTGVQTWRYASGLTGHAPGDAWGDGRGSFFIQLDADSGVKHVPGGTVVTVF